MVVDTGDVLVGKSVAADGLAGTALCWGCAPGASLLQLAQLAARHGFPEIHVQPGQYFDAGMEDVVLRGRLGELGVTVGVIDALMSGLPGLPDANDVRPEWRHLFLHSVDDCLKAATALGARTLNVAHFLGKPVDRRLMGEAVRRIAERAADVSVRITLEFIPDTGFADLATTLAIVEESGRDDVGVMFDTWHFLRSGGSPEQLRTSLSPRIFEAQISGRRRPQPGEPYVPMAGRLAPGEGDEPVAELARMLRRANQELVLAVEVFSADRGDPDATVGRLADATRALLRQLQRP
ncbi:sugar phosphate isomerase/epimerase family protein [Aminobacter sp. HY435]|uniref:sugar phosphate isomerase/epimerase family protein n=1 Tax=Aminobacter sp. HY435 TaxID=2970917 RepID=UPI0022B94EFE|nr:sugar phosphate isomerase/epimerase [Aminobacter sp. HY435]